MRALNEIEYVVCGNSLRKITTTRKKWEDRNRSPFNSRLETILGYEKLLNK